MLGALVLGTTPTLLVEAERQPFDEIVVRASRIDAGGVLWERRAVSREELDESGLGTWDAFLARLPQASGGNLAEGVRPLLWFRPEVDATRLVLRPPSIDSFAGRGARSM